jgi:branched-chain amino acid transport system permease protein
MKSVEILVMLVLGGLGSLTGSVISATFLTFLPELLRGMAEYRMVVYSLLLVIVMLTRPQGLLGTKEITDFFKPRSNRGDNKSNDAQNVTAETR